MVNLLNKNGLNLIVEDNLNKKPSKKCKKRYKMARLQIY